MEFERDDRKFLVIFLIMVLVGLILVFFSLLKDFSYKSLQCYLNPVNYMFNEFKNNTKNATCFCISTDKISPLKMEFQIPYLAYYNGTDNMDFERAG